MTEIKNVREMPQDKSSWKLTFWENLQLFCLSLTILGQVTIGASFVFGQMVWLAANATALIRDFALRRPWADKIKNAALLGITAGIIIAYYMGAY